MGLEQLPQEAPWSLRSLSFAKEDPFLPMYSMRRAVDCMQLSSSRLHYTFRLAINNNSQLLPTGYVQVYRNYRNKYGIYLLGIVDLV